MRLFNIDLSQAELRVMALLSGDEWMISALQDDGTDFFDDHMMPVCFPSIVEKWGTIKEFKEKQPKEYKEARVRVKSVQYGLAFGRQAPAIAQALKIPLHQADEIISNYLKGAPKFAQWRRDIIEAAISDEHRHRLVSPTGRRFQSEVVTTRNYRNIQREALSFLPQSTSSDICITAAATLHFGPLQRGTRGMRIINLVHDAIMFEYNERLYDDAAVSEFAAQCQQVIRETGANIMNSTAVPFLSDWSYGDTWADLT